MTDAAKRLAGDGIWWTLAVMPLAAALGVALLQFGGNPRGGRIIAAALAAPIVMLLIDGIAQ